MLDDTSDIKCRASNPNKVMGTLSFIWNTDEASLETKTRLSRAMPVNLALWNSETWSWNKTDLEKLYVFNHKSIRRILKIRMNEVERKDV